MQPNELGHLRNGLAAPTSTIWILGIMIGWKQYASSLSLVRRT
nr:MAG TPA: hypothetical protein [Caudoviricetes sp.]